MQEKITYIAEGVVIATLSALLLMTAYMMMVVGSMPC